MTEESIDRDLAEAEGRSPPPVRPLPRRLWPVTDGLFLYDTFSRSSNTRPLPDPSAELAMFFPFAQEPLVPRPGRPEQWLPARRRMAQQWNTGLSHALIETARSSGLVYGSTRPAVYLNREGEVLIRTTTRVPQTDEARARDSENQRKLIIAARIILQSRGIFGIDVQITVVE